MSRSRRLIAWLAAASLTVACAPKQTSDDDKEPEQTFEPSEKETDDGDEESSLFGGGGFGQFSFLSSMLSKRVKERGLYDPPRQSDGWKKSAEHYAVFDLGGIVGELQAFDLFGGGGVKELRVLQEHFDELAANERVVGVLIRLRDLEIDMTSAQELRASLQNFKSAGGRARKILCFADSIGNLGAFLTSSCDTIGLAPTGEVMITGVSAMPLYLKEMLDKVGLQPDFLHIGAFKGAAEPFTRTSPSPEMRKTIGAILDRAYRTMVSAIAQGRSLPEAKVRELIDKAVFDDVEAKEAGLIDVIATYEEFRETALAGAQWKQVKIDDEEPGFGKLLQLIGMSKRSRARRDHVALIYAVGAVIDGDGDGLLGARSEIASHTLVAALRAVAAADSVRAVVLRVSSGGGSALASEQIWRAAEELKAKKPLIVSMGDVAASGGYYIACGATKIFAMPNTITGSIGVVGGKFAIGGTLDKLGVRAYPMGRGRRSLIWSMTSKWSKGERAAVRGLMERVYRDFVNRVAQGRNKTAKQVHAVAQGRAWTGADAKERGLVDELGGLYAAVAEARRLGEVDADVPLEIYPPEPTLIDMVSQLGSVSAPSLLTEAQRTAMSVLGRAESTAVARVLRTALLFAREPVLAAYLVPVVVR